ncbi:MAG: YeeE/YedE family protein [Sphingomonas sp.]|nr:YeeE/YedE family protein [Sphingomonas sp.]
MSKPMTLIIIMLLFLIGYSSQRGGVCMVRAVREVIERRRFNRLAGFLLAAGSAMVAMALAEAMGARPFATILGARPDGLAIAGGILFGIGTRISGHCAMGTLAALAAGQLPRAASVAAMFFAAVLLGPYMSRAALMLPQRTPILSPLSNNIVLALTVGGILVVIAASYLYCRLAWRRPRGGWSPLVGMTLIGGASGALFALDQQWVYTSRIAAFAYGNVAFTPSNIAGSVALAAGMMIAAMVGGTFRLQLGSLVDWGAASVGGLLMGLGATLVPGGNDAMLFTGIPLLLPNLLIAYAAFFVTLYVGLGLTKKNPLRSEGHCQTNGAGDSGHP